MKPQNEDLFWKEAFSGLEKHQPRPGYAQRFWARADGVETLSPKWAWLPVGAVLAGLLLGLGVGQFRQQGSEKGQTGPLLSKVLPEGSLAEQFGLLQ